MSSIASFPKSLLHLSLISIEDLSNPQKYQPIIRHVTQQTSQHLLIYFHSSFFTASSSSSSSDGGFSFTQYWKVFQRFLGKIYGEAVRTAQSQGKVLWDVDVVFAELSGTSGERANADMVWISEDDTLTSNHITLKEGIQLKRVPRFEAIVSTGSASTPGVDGQEGKEPKYPVVALGGTFDHLHAGHKILLSAAIFIATRKVIVGVTSDELLKNKSNASIIEDIAVRKARAKAFCQLINPHLEYDMASISDVYGPTATEKDIQALVLSRETIGGGHQINEKRKELEAEGFRQLELFVIDVISSTTEEELEGGDREKDAKMKAVKMSSTFIRQYIVDHPQSSS